MASVLANVFSCSPIAKSWDLAITKGSCMNRPAFYFANAGLGIFTDFATVMVPMCVIPGLISSQLVLMLRVLLYIFQTIITAIAAPPETENCAWNSFGRGLFVCIFLWSLRVN